MTATIVFFAVLAGIVIFITLLLTLCALQMSAKIDRNSQLASNQRAIVPNHLLTIDRRKVIRQDFPIACNDGSYAWVDRRRTAAQ